MKRFMCLLTALFVFGSMSLGCRGNRDDSQSSEQSTASDSADSTDSSDTSKPNDGIWNNDPVVTGTFYDDFSEGVRTDVWQVSNQKWGANNNGTSPANVMYSRNRSKVAAEGADGGIVVMRSRGDLQTDPTLRRQGAAIITRDTFGPGKFEVRMKVMPRLGAVTAAWTYYSNGGMTKETNKYSEIDIELPHDASFKKWSGTTYEYFYDWGVLAERGTVINEYADGLNNGEWHTFAYEWRTNKATGDYGVVWYIDGVKVNELREYVPNYKAAFWVGHWFPDDAGWIGFPNFEEAYMYVDWVRITQYDDPVMEGGGGGPGGGTATDLGTADIPQNDYVANGTLRIANGELRGWTSNEDAFTVNGSGVTLNPSSRLTQMISAQYAGYSFTLTADAKVLSGSGKCKISVDYMIGSVRFGGTEALEFDAAGGTKTLDFTVTGSNVTDLRVVITTEEGVTATVNNVSLNMK